MPAFFQFAKIRRICGTGFQRAFGRWIPAKLLKEFSVNIYGSSPRPIDRMPSAIGRSSYGSANEVRPGDAGGSDVEAARNAALSALRNDRFGTMLTKITEPAASGALMTMKRDAGDTGSAGAAFNSVLSSYLENGE